MKGTNSQGSSKNKAKKGKPYQGGFGQNRKKVTWEAKETGFRGDTNE